MIKTINEESMKQPAPASGQNLDIAQSVVKIDDDQEVTLTISKVEVPEIKSGQFPIASD